MIQTGPTKTSKENLHVDGQIAMAQVKAVLDVTVTILQYLKDVVNDNSDSEWALQVARQVIGSVIGRIFINLEALGQGTVAE